MQALFLPALLLATAGSAPPVQAPDVAYVGARIEIGDGRVLENSAIIVRGDRITLVGGVPVPSGATVVDVKGLTVYPGFIDAYSNSGLKLPDPIPSGKDLPDVLNTAPATMWKENRKGIRSDVRAANCLDFKGPFTEQYSNGVTSVLLSGGVGLMAGTSAFVELGATPKVLKPEAASEIVFPRGGGGFGGDVHGGYDDAMLGAQRPGGAQSTTPTYGYPGTPFGQYALIRQTLWDAIGYIGQPQPKPEPTYEGLKPLILKMMPAIFTVGQAREIARAGHFADEFGFRFIVNGATEGYRMIDTLKKYDAPVILSLYLEDEPSLKVEDRPDATPKRVLEARYDLWKERMGNAKALDAAGIPLAFKGTTLAGVRKMIAAGLPRASALRALTINPARMYGVADQVGSIGPTKRANLVFMTGDFADEKSKVQFVLVDGTRTEMEKAK